MINNQNKLTIIEVKDKKEFIEDFNKKLPTEKSLELVKKIMKMTTWIK